MLFSGFNPISSAFLDALMLWKIEAMFRICSALEMVCQSQYIVNCYVYIIIFYIWTYEHMDTCVYIYIYLFMDIHIYMWMDVYIYIWICDYDIVNN